jgi:hypothetical protein
MNITLVLARFWGVILVVLCGSLLVHAKFYFRLVKAFQDESVRFLYFFVVLVIGAVCVAVHNEWEPNVRGLITLLGWGSLLKGIFGVAFPETYNKIIIDRINLTPALLYSSAVIFLGIGCILLFVGFVR